MSGDSLGDRMKGYENVWRTEFPRRLPVMLRIDGKAFSSYTQGCERPWDPDVHEVMEITAIALCEEIQGVQIAYTQSDEISLLLHGYKRLQSQPWFDNNLQKMVSVAASVAGATFTAHSGRIWEGTIKPAYFDCRAYILPEHEVCNAFLWRQQDATRNSVQMLARSLFSHKECTGKNSSELQEMCFQKGSPWNELPTEYKRGRCIVREHYHVETANGPIERTRWTVDREIPIFSQDRNYIEKYLATED